ncbi:MAG: DUF362 domain-containing protein [Phycisphaerae bacterium]|nr:DUF362 domain-containing protein [Phycisphaerae bacterium]
MMMDEFGWMSRRELLRAGAAGALAALLPGRLLWGDAANAAAKIWVFHGPDKTRLMNACLNVIDQNGGLGRNVRKLTLKVNAAWARTPRQGANTHPELVDAFLKGCRKRGVRDLVLPEHPCDRSEESFTQSGLQAVARENHARMLDLRKEKNAFIPRNIPRGKNLRRADVAREVLETDALVNLPVVKHHGAARMTAAMKNWMGSVHDRGAWHRNQLHQCIADFSTLVQPRWTILDATRVMLDWGPRGPTRNMKIPDLLILSRDPVAADAYASTLLSPRGPGDVRYLVIAGRMGLGETDVEKMSVKKIEVE